ncbi:redox-sensitive transcriptional activator SoxR [Streptomyces sp. NBC_00138]|nr:redox-sensitive transcriptional activator SoxR [Streptomyces sp. NBC_00223]
MGRPVRRPSPTATELTVGEVAARCGVAVTTLHFYESKGLISSRRTPGNQRRYARDTLRRVSLIRVAQRLGIPLSVVRDALDALPSARTPSTQDWAELSQRWRDDLTERIAELTTLRDSLTDCMGCGCLSVSACPLNNPYDNLGAQGPGPQRLFSRRAPDDSDGYHDDRTDHDGGRRNLDVS